MTQKDNPDLIQQTAAFVPIRAAGLAVDPRKMLLGGLALLSLCVGDWIFESLPFADARIRISVHPAEEDAMTRGLSYAGVLHRRYPSDWLSWDFAAYSLLTPVRSVVEPGRVIFDMPGSWSRTAFAWTQLLWALIVWSLFGGALCRMNALQAARRKRIGPIEALKFSRRQLTAYLLAPLLPLSAILILLLINWLFGFFAGNVPLVGRDLAGMGWVFVLFTGFLMAMMLVGILTGWPLMIAAISTEDSDGFDGLSRAFGYLFDRPWQAAVLAATSFPIFALSRLLVALLIGLTVTLGMQAVAGGAGDSIADESGLTHFGVTQQGISPGGKVATKVEDALLNGRRFSWPSGIGPAASTFWLAIPGLLLAGFAPSFFWAAATVIYFQLRLSDDGTALASVTDWEAGQVPVTGSHSTGADDEQTETDRQA